MSQSNDRPSVKPTNEARQAVVGHNVRHVLAASLIGVIVVFGLIYLYYFH